nr:hypothetical protein [uncultured Leptotrichia sp.]
MESFEDAEKRDFVGTISGIVKIVGIMIFTWGVLIFQRGIFGSYYFNSVAKTGDLKAGEMVTLVQTLFSLVVLIILSVIFIKMMKARFGKENLNKIKFWTFVIIVITFVLFALGVTFSMINSIVKNIGSISLSDKITIFFKTGILEGIKGMQLIGFLLTMCLFSIKVYENNKEKSLFAIIFSGVSSIILMIIFYFAGLFLDLYLLQTSQGWKIETLSGFIREIMQNANMQEVVFNYYFYLTSSVVVIFTIILILNVFSDNKKKLYGEE